MPPPDIVEPASVVRGCLACIESLRRAASFSVKLAGDLELKLKKRAELLAEIDRTGQLVRPNLDLSLPLMRPWSATFCGTSATGYGKGALDIHRKRIRYLEDLRLKVRSDHAQIRAVRDVWPGYR